MKDRTISILGEKWEILFKRESEDKELENTNGYADCSTRKIIICNLQKEPGSLASLGKIMNKTLRHEIIHAALFESGLLNNSDWAKNEECVDWIALQFPKLQEIFKKEGIDK